jgi:hypothetical protein
MTEQPASLYGQELASPVPETPGLLDQITGVFTEPKALLSRLRRRPSWAPALLFAIAVGLIAMLIWASKVDMAEVTRHQMERTKEIFHMNIPDQAIDEAIAKAEGKKPWLSAVSGAVFGTPFFYLIMTLATWAFSAMGIEEGEETPSFGQAFSVTSVHSLVAVPSMLLAGIIALLRPVGGHNIQALMPTVLSFYVSPESPLLRGLAALVDPLWIFSFVVLAIGMKQTLKTKPWAIGACLTVMGLFGGGLRFLGGMFQ